MKNILIILFAFLVLSSCNDKIEKFGLDHGDVLAPHHVDRLFVFEKDELGCSILTTDCDEVDELTDYIDIATHVRNAIMVDQEIWMFYYSSKNSYVKIIDKKTLETIENIELDDSYFSMRLANNGIMSFKTAYRRVVYDVSSKERLTDEQLPLDEMLFGKKIDGNRFTFYQKCTYCSVILYIKDIDSGDTIQSYTIQDENIFNTFFDKDYFYFISNSRSNDNSDIVLNRVSLDNISQYSREVLNNTELSYKRIFFMDGYLYSYDGNTIYRGDANTSSLSKLTSVDDDIVNMKVDKVNQVIYLRTVNETESSERIIKLDKDANVLVSAPLPASNTYRSSAPSRPIIIL